MNFKDSIMRLHPDFNSGDTSTVGEFTKLMQQRRDREMRDRRCANPVCGKPTFKKARQMKHNKAAVYCSVACAIFKRFHSRKLTAAIVALMAMISIVQAQSNLVWLTWNYSSNSLAQSDASGFQTYFLIKGTNSVTLPFALLSDRIWTNYPISSFDGTNYTFKTNCPLNTEGSFFFVTTASNAFWGESINSNTSSTPPVSVQFKLNIAPN